MKHNIKLPDGTIRTIDCRLGSSMFDKNGREIFEDDKVKINSHYYGKNAEGHIFFEFGELVFGGHDKRFNSVWGRLRFVDDYEIKIVGHVDD